jgi:hypothetical protein
VGFIDVYRNGVMLGSADYTATNGLTVILASGATAGDLVEVISFSVSSVLNAMPTTGGTFSGNVLFDSGDGIWNTSGNVGIGTTSPTAKLHVVNGDVTFVTNDANGYARFTQNSGSAQLGLFRSGSGSTGGGYIGADGTNCLDVRDAAFVTEMRVTQAGDLQINSGYGSVATAYGCRAWVNFNGTGTVAIRASGNVSSITDGGTGNYTVNLTTALPDANGSVTGGGFYFSDFTSNGEVVQCALSSTSAVRITTGSTSARQDFNFVNIAVFR